MTIKSKSKKEKRVYLSREEYITQIENNARLYLEGEHIAKFDLVAYMEDVKALENIWNYAWVARNPTERAWKWFIREKNDKIWGEKRRKFNEEFIARNKEYHEKAAIIDAEAAERAARGEPEPRINGSTPRQALSGRYLRGEIL